MNVKQNTHPSRIEGNLQHSPPIARKIPKILEKHGDQRSDPYYWLNQREDAEVLNYLQAENEYRESAMAPTKDLQDQIFKEIVGRIKQTDQSVPVRDNGYWYMTRVEEGKEYPIYSRKKDEEGAAEEVFLDVNVLAQGHAYYHIGGHAVSPNNRYLVYGEDKVSRRIYTLRVLDLETGILLDVEIPSTTGQAVWAKDNQTIFYTRKDESLRAHQVYRHKLGTSLTEDALVYDEKDDTFHIHVFASASKEMILIGSEQTVTSEYHFLRADDPDAGFSVLHPRERNLEYDVDHLNGFFVIRTNWDAQNFRLMIASESSAHKAEWKELIPHRAKVLLEGVALFHHSLVLQERCAGISQIRVRSWEGKEDHQVAFGEEAYLVQLGSNPDPGHDRVRLIYTSMTTPVSVFDYQMASRKLHLMKEEEVVGSFSKEDYQSERLLARTSDGVEVPISIVYKKGFAADRPGPLLLYGYGSYGISIDPHFSSARLSLLDRGFAFAIAHIRGGEDLGRYWYEQGRQLSKMNSFTDFIACAEFLIHKKYTQPDKLFAMGGSAGGLLMGAVINLRPELWKGVIAAVPFVDVVTTMLDESIPLTTGEYDEWGNPNDLEYYQYIKSYSPYDNVVSQDYPALLITTGLHDSQVQYWEPAKWVARLREVKTDNRPLLMYCNMETGHGGASGRFERHRETAMEYAFLLDLAGMIA
ncbi:MAG: S9 family peptidase [Saprospiraceae bacterium]|nr:S9 family peptidase [Saprospiraceae bacterium]